MDPWIKKQIDKYANKNFGEPDLIVERKYKAYLKAMEFVRPGVTFLDLGTNSGRIALEAKKLGAKELGVDLPEVIAKITYDINKVAMDLEKDYPEGSFDVIFCRETIEHLRTYADVAKKIVASLAPDGILVMTAPNSKVDFGRNCPEHVRVFEGTQLDKMITDSGGVIVEAFNERRQRVVVAKKK